MILAPLPAIGQASGTVVSVRGSVVEARFEAYLPAIHNILLAGAKDQIVIEVLAQQDAHHVRGIALTPTQGQARGHCGIRDRGDGGIRHPEMVRTSITDSGLAPHTSSC